MSYEVLHAIERGCSAFGSPAVAILLGVAAYRFNRLQTQLAAGQAKTAQYQAGLAAEKLRRDLYDRRYAILEAAQRLLWLPHGFPNPSVKAGVKVGQRGGAKVGQWMAMQLLSISWGRASGA
jgi:hypothetical protein